MSAERLAILFHRHRTEMLSEGEREELLALLADPVYADTVRHLLDQAWANFMPVASPFTDQQLAAMLAHVQATRDLRPEVTIRQAHRVHFLRTAWFRVAVAVLIVAVISGYLWMQVDDKGPQLTDNQQRDRVTTPEILPGGDKAMLVLGDESVIALDTAASGLLVQQGESEVIKTGKGEIIYNGGRGASADADAVYYQQLITPRGGQYRITLSDGTQVWLNAESSIRFPNVFIGNNRTVEMTGEVYFDVKADRTRPFVVKAGNNNTSREITVLGTRFNVNAYSNEDFKASLENGKVKVANKILRPGQAYVNGKIIATDVNQDIAWTRGTFNFNNLTMAEAARQIARWYDVEVVFDGPVPTGKIFGGVKRSLSLQELLSEMEGEFAHFELKGRVLHISAI